MKFTILSIITRATNQNNQLYIYHTHCFLGLTNIHLSIDNDYMIYSVNKALPHAAQNHQVYTQIGKIEV